MAVPRIADRVQETAPAPALGAIALSGSAPAGFLTLAAAGFVNLDYSYFIAIDSAANWEIFGGVYTSSGNSLARTNRLNSSAAGAAINFALGVNVLMIFPASKALLLDSTGIFDLAVFRKFGEATNAVTATTGTTTLDLSLGGVQLLTLNANTALTFSNPLASGTSSSFLLKAIQDGTGSRTITWPASVRWAGATPPTISTGANKVDIFSFNTTDNGTTWHGFTAGIGF